MHRAHDGSPAEWLASKMPAARHNWMIWPLCFLESCSRSRPPASGETHYVNNQSGDDASDGLSPEKALATIARAIQNARTSDTISLANTGRAYREPIPLTHGRYAGPAVCDRGQRRHHQRTPPASRGAMDQDREVYEIAIPKPYGFPYLRRWPGFAASRRSGQIAAGRLGLDHGRGKQGE